MSDTAVVRRNADQAIMAMATAQHGMVSRAQILHAGLTNKVIDVRVRNGFLSRVHRSVYRVGPVTGPQAREMAAVLACGAGAAVSGRSAAVLWRMLGRAREEAPVEVIVPSRRPLPAGVMVHHVRTVRAGEITTIDNIPVTTPARTLFDLAAAGHEREVEHALAEALLQRIVTRSDVLALASDHAGRAGARQLRELIEADEAPGVTRSEAEERFLALIRTAQLTLPSTNVPVAGYEVDFLWRKERLVVEVDGRAFHARRRRFESDHRRESVLVAAGLRVMRVTWNQIVNEREALLARVARALAMPVQAWTVPLPPA
jgi:very-short-patch-repair endonuclease